MLEASEPLVERLWRSEVAAGPLATPEDRAGLKQRLGAHMANIADAEIRRHYADAFRERFDTLFAAKPRAPFVPGQKAAETRLAQTADPAARSRDQELQRQKLGLSRAGCAGALLRNPALIQRHTKR